ncbi:hypothetical protein [Maioricimonas sp. JC845]|uniref:hypothetical protein n=1 Tax=Maioricimonas sp. JC845 TaxID=3232138 RepID=UPI0034575CE4
MRSLLCILLFGIAMIPVFWIRADVPPPPVDRPADLHAPPRPAGPFRRDRRPPLPADLKSVELEFTVNGDQTLAVVATSGRFATSADVATLGAEMDIRIEGVLRPLESGESWIVDFDATMHRNDVDNDNDSTFTAAGSVVVELNSKVTLARLPGPDLSVTVRPARH